MPERDKILVEVCVDSIAGALTAAEGDADRIEVCSALSEGGTTPSAGMVAKVRQECETPLVMMIRPRRGDFLYSPQEIDAMRRDIDVAKELGVSGVALGALTAEGNIDTEATEQLVARARPLEVTFHRAFDHCLKPLESLDTLIDLGIDRLLTSGQETTALAGTALIGKLVERARGRISIMPGGGIRTEHVRQLVAATDVREIHFSASRNCQSKAGHCNPRVALSSPDQPGDDQLRIADADLVRLMKAELAAR